MPECLTNVSTPGEDSDSAISSKSFIYAITMCLDHGLMCMCRGVFSRHSHTHLNISSTQRNYAEKICRETMQRTFATKTYRETMQRNYAENICNENMQIIYAEKLCRETMQRMGVGVRPQMFNLSRLVSSRACAAASSASSATTSRVIPC